MKKLLLAFLTVIALSGAHTAQCFTLWPFGSEDTTTYDLTKLKTYLTTSKTPIRFSYKKDTIYMECRGVGPFSGNRVTWIRSLPYVTNVNVLTITQRVPDDNNKPKFQYETFHLEITLKHSAYQELTSWWINLNPPKQDPLLKIANLYVFGKTAQ